MLPFAVIVHPMIVDVIDIGVERAVQLIGIVAIVTKVDQILVEAGVDRKQL